MNSVKTSGVHKINRVNISRPNLIVVFFGLMAIISLTWLLLFSHFNVITGEYAYDPRTDTPSRLVFQNTPESVLIEVLSKQIQRDGTYPPGAPPIKGYEPIHTQVNLYTDWLGMARVTMLLEYASGEQVEENFRLMAINDTILIPFIDFIGYLKFDQIALCSPTFESHISYCALQSEVDGYVAP